MGRTREAALRGAVRAIAKYGSRKATMADIAMIAGVAKATLYNHFRTRDDVYQAVIASEVDAIAGAASARLLTGVEVALAEAARLIAEHPAVRRVAADEPAVLAGLATPGDGPAWSSARAHLVTALGVAGCCDSADAVDLVLRYLASLLLAPSDEAGRAACIALLHRAVALPTEPPAALPAAVGATPVE